MIEFSGTLTGNALKYFYKRYIRLIQIMLVQSDFAIYGIFCFKSFLFRGTLELRQFIVFLVIAVLLAIISHPLVKVTKKNAVPKKITVKDDTLLCVGEVATEVKQIQDVKEVYDYGDFYALSFPFFGNSYSLSFVCQKDLLSKGTLEEFEALFEGKIVKKNS